MDPEKLKDLIEVSIESSEERARDARQEGRTNHEYFWNGAAEGLRALLQEIEQAREDN